MLAYRAQRAVVWFSVLVSVRLRHDPHEALHIHETFPVWRLRPSGITELQPCASMSPGHSKGTLFRQLEGADEVADQALPKKAKILSRLVRKALLMSVWTLRSAAPHPLASSF